MKAGRLVAWALVSGLMLTSAASFAQNTGTRIGKDADVRDVAKLTRLLAECVVERRPSMVRNWLKELPGTVAEARYIERQEGDLGICLEDKQLVFAGAREMVYTPKSLRNPIALAFARQRLRKNAAPPAGLSADSMPWFTQPLAALPADSRLDKVALAFQDFGHCVASTNWAGSRSLLLSEAGTAEERAAVQVLAPSLGPCLDQNAKIKLTPANLRIALAEPMLHIMLGAGAGID